MDSKSGKLPVSPHGLTLTVIIVQFQGDYSHIQNDQALPEIL